MTTRSLFFAASLTLFVLAPLTFRNLRREPVIADAQPAVSSCCTQYGKCGLSAPLPPGTVCACVTPQGVFSGSACP